MASSCSNNTSKTRAMPGWNAANAEIFPVFSVPWTCTYRVSGAPSLGEETPNILSVSASWLRVILSACPTKSCASGSLYGICTTTSGFACALSLSKLRITVALSASSRCSR